MRSFRGYFSKIDLQAKISLVLVSVIVPTFFVVTLAEYKFTQPLLEDEILQIGVAAAKRMAAEVVSTRALSLPNPTPAIEDIIQEALYSTPNIIRMEVLAKDPATGQVKVMGSNVEDEPGTVQGPFTLVDAVTYEFVADDLGLRYWDIQVPIEQKGRDPKSAHRTLGAVHVNISTRIVDRLTSLHFKTTATAAAFSVIALLLFLSYFLRKTIENDRKLKTAQSQNLQLTEQLHEAQRDLMNSEKLAVMGQLTASFAHEIGTPLNAIGGHLQLLQEEVEPRADSGTKPVDRLGIIQGQLGKIEQIVKTFLQSTAKPSSQKQLVDVNQLAEKTLSIVRPRIEAMGVQVTRNLNREMTPVRMVPLDLEQILLNLINNSLDSLKSKRKDGASLDLRVFTDLRDTGGKLWAEIEIYDTGEGIKKQDLKQVLKPFFTTKPPGEGTGLGLAICQQLVHKYGGEIIIDSREGSWTRVTLRIPV